MVLICYTVLNIAGVVVGFCLGMLMCIGRERRRAGNGSARAKTTRFARWCAT